MKESLKLKEKNLASLRLCGEIKRVASLRLCGEKGQKAF
jgi:hypothetical protein